MQHLVGRAAIAAGDGKQFFHVVDIEIRHAPAEDLAVALQALEGADGFGERHASPPMQEIQVEAIGAKPRKASLACGDGALRSGILRIDLADQEHFVAPAVDVARGLSQLARETRTRVERSVGPDRM